MAVQSSFTRRAAGFTQATAACACAFMLIGASPANALISPLWITTLPTGTSLSSGLMGMTTSASGVTYITGIAGSSNNSDILTAAIATDGSILWQDTWNGPANWHDQSRGIFLGPDGFLYVTGNTPGPGSYANVLILKYDAVSGDLLDTIIYSSGPQTSEYAASVVVDAAGNVYAAGGTVGDGSDGLIVSFDAEGDFRWSRDYDGPAWGPYSQDNILQLKLAPDGNPVAMIHGVMASNHPDYVVIKYDAGTGANIWSANWGVTGGDFATDMEIDAAGDIYVTGTGINFIDKYSTIKLAGDTGALIWQAYDFIGNDQSASAVALDAKGGVYITGSSDPEGNHSNFNDNFYTIKRDAETGAQLWTHFYGQNCVGCYDVARDVLTDSSGHTFVVGSTSSPPYSSDMILFVLDSETGVEIDRSVLDGGAGQSAGGNVLRFDAQENLYVGGQTSNPSTGEKIITVTKYASFAPQAVQGDVDGDGSVNVDDLLAVITGWGRCPQAPATCAADIAPESSDGDGTVDVDDLLMVITNWG